MWKKTIPVNLINKSNLPGLQSARTYNNGEIVPRYRRGVPKVGWFRRKGSRLLYPTSHPSYMRRIGVDLNLQQRLDQMFIQDNEEQKSRVDIGKISLFL